MRAVEKPEDCPVSPPSTRFLGLTICGGSPCRVTANRELEVVQPRGRLETERTLES